MHPYHTRESVVGDIPATFLLDALDDDRDGVEDAGLYDTIAGNASNAVDAYLEARIATPMAQPVAIAREASRIFCLESLYRRRGFSKDTDPPNPWHAQASEWRARLGRIASGEEPLQLDRSGPGVDTIVEPSRTTSASGRMGV